MLRKVKQKLFQLVFFLSESRIVNKILQMPIKQMLSHVLVSLTAVAIYADMGLFFCLAYLFFYCATTGFIYWQVKSKSIFESDDWGLKPMPKELAEAIISHVEEGRKQDATRDARDYKIIKNEDLKS